MAAFVIHISDSIYPQYETKKKENIIVCMAKQEESNNLWFMLSSLWNVLISEHTLVCCGIHSSQK